MEREKKKYCLWSPLELDETFPFLSHLLLCPCACDCCSLLSHWLSICCITQADRASTSAPLLTPNGEGVAGSYLQSWYKWKEQYQTLKTAITQ